MSTRPCAWIIVHSVQGGRLGSTPYVQALSNALQRDGARLHNRDANKTEHWQVTRPPSPALIEAMKLHWQRK